MTFTELLAMVGHAGNYFNICSDSRKVTPGDVFVAIKGTESDGHNFIDQAIKNGANFIVSQTPKPATKAKTAKPEFVTVSNSAESLGLLAQASKAYPSSKLTNLAVTGTNGKTTVSYMTRAIIESTAKKCGLIGTICHSTGTNSQQAEMTTPDAIDIAKMAAEMINANAEYMVIEASSHALSQHRLAGINFTAAAFTNLTGDHLDYHGTAEEYLAAKTRLFTDLPCHAIAVLNKQSPQAHQIAQKINVRKIWYAIEEDADISATIESMDARQTVCQIQFGWQKATVQTPLIGTHNISNMLAAAGLCIAAGFDLEAIAMGLSELDCVPGRLEKIDCGQDFSVLIDYAHTDDALKNVLETLRPLCNGKLTVIFGCGGDRDKTKRPRMAKVAEQLADRVIVTNDNPRTENPDSIIDDIRKGFTNPDSRKIHIEPDRKTAIELAIKTAFENDIILIAGKGHEDYQIIGTEKFHFDDSEVATAALKDLK